MRNLAKLTLLPHAYWDERISTAAVTRELTAQGVSRAKRAEVVDRMAAAYILQGGLDRLAWPSLAPTHATSLSRKRERDVAKRITRSRRQ